MNNEVKDTGAIDGVRHLLNEGEYVIETGEPADLVESLRVVYSEKGREVLPAHKRVVALVLEDYDPVTMMKARRQGFDPEGICS